MKKKELEFKLEKFVDSILPVVGWLIAISVIISCLTLPLGVVIWSIQWILRMMGVLV